MGKKKRTYQVGDTFVRKVESVFSDKAYWFNIHYIIEINQEKKPWTQKVRERFTLLTICIFPNGKFKNHIHKLYRPTLNNYLRKEGKPLREYLADNKLEFLILNGKSINEVIQAALERHKKHHKRHFIQINPELIKINTEEEEEV